VDPLHTNRGAHTLNGNQAAPAPAAPVRPSDVAPDLQYFINGVSPIQNWVPCTDRVANQLSANDVNIIVAEWIQMNDLLPVFGGMNPALPPNCLVETAGNLTVAGHFQATIPAAVRPLLSIQWPQAQVKMLRHNVVWRWQNGGALIPEGLHISHCHANKHVLNLVAESPRLNESRKGCHEFGWNQATDANGVLLCPHRSYKRCT
jgi:hypothetical protein